MHVEQASQATEDRSVGYHRARIADRRASVSARWPDARSALTPCPSQAPTSSARAVHQMVSYRAAPLPLPDPRELRSCGASDGQLPHSTLTPLRPPRATLVRCTRWSATAQPPDTSDPRELRSCGESDGQLPRVCEMPSCSAVGHAKPYPRGVACRGGHGTAGNRVLLSEQPARLLRLGRVWSKGYYVGTSGEYSMQAARNRLAHHLRHPRAELAGVLNVGGERRRSSPSEAPTSRARGGPERKGRAAP